MSLGTAIEFFRARQQELFTSTCTVTRPSTTALTFNPNTGVLTPVAPTTIYTGSCLVRPAGGMGGGQGSDTQAGEREVRLVDLTAKLPVNTDARKDDILTVTASTYDSGLVGRAYRITDVLRDDWQIARVVMLEEVT